MNTVDDRSEAELANEAWWESIKQAEGVLCRAMHELGYRHTMSSTLASGSTKTYEHTSGYDVVLVIRQDREPPVMRFHVKTTDPAIFGQLNIIAQHTDKYADAYVKAWEEARLYQELGGTKRKLVGRVC